MSIKIPEDIDRWCASAAEALKRKRASERAADAELERIAKENTARWLRERPTRIDCGHRIFAWLLEVERAGVRHKVAGTGLLTLTIWGPMWPWGGTSVGCTGSYWVRLPLAGELGLVLGNRVHACAGRERILASVEALADAMPTGICALVAREISSGEVWERVRRAVERPTGLEMLPEKS